jgi:hypothetical protein
MDNRERQTHEMMTLADRLYDDEQREFLAACDRYRRAKHKLFLAATDYLEVLKSLGYRRPEQPGAVPEPS